MSKDLSVKTPYCTDYERLLEECQSALETWNKRRAENYQSRVNGKEAGDELLRLQARFARAYAVLRRHSQDCLLCQLVARIEGRGSENSSAFLSDSTLYV